MKEQKLPYDVKRDFLRKSHDQTDDKYGCDPSKRPISEHIAKGVINLDKPAGPTSHEAVAWIKKIFNIEKAGHGGTLELPSARRAVLGSGAIPGSPVFFQ